MFYFHFDLEMEFMKEESKSRHSILFFLMKQNIKS